ncbi:MAG TPA: hypothetical protein V6D17_16275 [Candidatus Obscuribacterales bacterium]
MFEDLMPGRFSSEQDFRLATLNALLRTPHRNVAPFIPLFRRVHDHDPRFFGHLAAWYFDHGTVHDLKQLFIAFMATSKYDEEWREAGLAMLQKLPPYQVERVIRLIKGYKDGENRVAGIVASPPRSLKTAVEQYLRKREADHKAFDSTVLHARKSVKMLYATFRIKPGEYAQKILFENNPPPSSRLAVLKEIAKCEKPSEQARLIVENNIPYRVAISVVKHMTPTVLVAIVNAMTPQEVINNLASLKKRGAMDDADLRKLIEHKLNQGKSDTRVSALKTRQALAAASLDDEMTKMVEDVGDKQIKAKGKITRPTALLVDKSGSMDIAIDVGKQIASIIAPICEADLFVYAFDSMAFPITAKGKELSDWERAFKGIRAEGNTSCGVAIEMMRRKKQVVEQVVIVTDQGENTAPFMAPALAQYGKENPVPSVIIVNVGRHTDQIERALRAGNVEVDTFTYNGDYYSLPSLIPMLAGGTRLELLMDIMSYELPRRKDKELTVSAKS